MRSKSKYFIQFLKKFKGRVLILSHQNSDPDAVCSSVALSMALEKIGIKDITVGVAESISKTSKKILKEFRRKAAVNPEVSADLIIVVDTSTLNQLQPVDKNLKHSKVKKAVIDHHIPHKDTKDIADFYIVDENASSTAEVVYRLLKDAGIKLDNKIGLAILLGIISDTAHLKLASAKTLQTVNEILENTEVDYKHASSILEMQEDISKKLAHLKVAQRMEIYRIMDWVVVTSEVGSYGASAAKALTVLGADLAFVGSINKNEMRISARASQNFIRNTGLNLGKDIMPRIGKIMNGSGGGHSGAAGAEGEKGDLNKILKECVKIVQEFLHE